MAHIPSPHLGDDDTPTDKGSVEEAIQRLDPISLRVMEALAVYGRPLSLSGLEYLLEPYMKTAALPEALNRLAADNWASFDNVSGLYSLDPLDQEICAARVPEGSAEDRSKPELSPRIAELIHKLKHLGDTETD